MFDSTDPFPVIQFYKKSNLFLNERTFLTCRECTSRETERSRIAFSFRHGTINIIAGSNFKEQVRSKIYSLPGDNMDLKSRFYKKAKRERSDYCNICGQFATLTYDHIPPKCCFNDIKATPIETMSGEPEKYNPFCSQNGIKFRSICSQCNNGLLAKYDKALEAFVVKLKEILTSEPTCTHKAISIRATAVAKSICGHLLAMKGKYDDQCLVDQEFRPFVLDPETPPPQGYSLLLRYYPFSTVFFMRDSVILNIAKKQEIPDGTISVLSSFPLAFILCKDSSDCGMIDLFRYCSGNIEDRTDIDFDFTSAYFPGSSVMRDPKWPCNIDDTNYGVSGVLCSEFAAKESTLANRDPTIIKAKLFTKGNC